MFKNMLGSGSNLHLWLFTFSILATKPHISKVGLCILMGCQPD